MKLTVNLIIFSIHSFVCSSQTIDTIWYENGNKYIIIKEQDKVWIHLKKGRPLKGVKLNTIDIKHGKIEYLSGGVFHDQLISNVKKITPGNDYGEVIYIKNDSLLLLKKELNTHSVEITDFFLLHEAKKNYTTNYNTFENSSENDNTPDSLFYSDGKILLIKVQEISPSMLIYKRLDLPEGPIYKMAITEADVRLNDNNYSIDFRKK